MKKLFVKYWPLLILIMPILFYLPFLGKISFPKGSPYSDLVISHLPNAIFANRAIFQAHQIPLWNDTIMSGYPFLANPLSGLWYPPLWLAVLLPFSVTFNILFLGHIILAGVGLFILLREYGLKTNAALVAALAFECLPKIWAHYAAGHVTLVYAVSWTPLLLYFAKKRWQKRTIFFNLTPELLVLAAIILCDVRWTAYSVAIWTVFSINLLFTRSGEIRRKWKFHDVLKAIAQLVIHMAVQVCLALTLTAIFILPFLEFVSLSTRAALSPAQNLLLSLSPLKLLNLIVPNIGGYAEWILYIGSLGVICLFILLFHTPARKKVKFWLILMVVCLLFSLGSYIPGLSAVYSLPVINLLRVPARINFLTGFLACCLIGFAIDHFEQEKKISPWSRLTLVAIILSVLLLAIGISVINKRIETSIFWAFLALSGCLILFELFAKNRIQIKVFCPLMVLLTIADLMGVNLLSMDFRTLAQIKSQEGEPIQQIVPDLRTNRIYSPSFTVSQLTASTGGFSMVNGIDPLSLRTYSSFIEIASGVPVTGYSVTLPPLATGDPQRDNIAYVPDATRLGLLNAKYLIADYPLKTSHLDLISNVDEHWIYLNQKSMPRAWVQQNDNFPIEKYRAVDALDYFPNEIKISATGPGVLVLSEIDYPGWVAKVDGKDVPVKAYYSLLRSIHLDPGKHEIVFLYHPRYLLPGILISSSTAIILILYAFLHQKRKRPFELN